MVTSKELVSIIVPVYNVRDYLIECVQSICKQSYNELEIILVDDGSPDDCGQMCDVFAENDKRIKVVHKVNGGLSSARNAGIDVATGEYIAFVDGDDVLREEAIEKLLSAAKKTGAFIVKQEIRRNLPWQDSQEDALDQIKKWTAKEYIKSICEYKASVSFCDKLFKKEIFNDFRFSEERLNEDLLLLSTILIKCKYDIYGVCYQGYYYRQRENSITRKRFGKSIQDTILNCRDLIELAQKSFVDVVDDIKTLSLYQAMIFFIEMPKKYIKEKSESYLLAYKLVKENKNYIKKAFFKNKFKFFLRLWLFFPRGAKALADMIVK